MTTSIYCININIKEKVKNLINKENIKHNFEIKIKENLQQIEKEIKNENKNYKKKYTFICENEQIKILDKTKDLNQYGFSDYTRFKFILRMIEEDRFNASAAIRMYKNFKKYYPPNIKPSGILYTMDNEKFKHYIKILYQNTKQ